MLIVHDRSTIENFLRQNVHLHLYSLGDLDDFFWSDTTWYALKHAGEITALALMYTGEALPVLLALSQPLAPMRILLSDLLRILPRRFYSHLSPGLEDVLAGDYCLEAHGAHHKMALRDPAAVQAVDTSQAVNLTREDLPAIQDLYAVSYPGNWFDSRMLETGRYYGVWDGAELRSIAGIHVYSPTYRVAALGNITTHPAFRGRGLGRQVTAKLCQELLPVVDHIGLNVKADNQTAIQVYRKLGFEVIADYGEYNLAARQPADGR